MNQEDEYFKGKDVPGSIARSSEAMQEYSGQSQDLLIKKLILNKDWLYAAGSTNEWLCIQFNRPWT
jgi:hypothetical protein